MKVYELLSELLQLPAGADVGVSTLVTLEELQDRGPIDVDNGVSYYEVFGAVKELEEVDSMKVMIYL